MTDITIYTKPWCPFCIRAKMLLKKKSLSFEEIDLSGQPGRRDEMMDRAGGAQTVPQIFYKDHHLGGCDELYALDRSGELDKLVLG